MGIELHHDQIGILIIDRLDRRKTDQMLTTEQKRNGIIVQTVLNRLTDYQQNRPDIARRQLQIPAFA